MSNDELRAKTISFKDAISLSVINTEKVPQTRALVERELLHLGIKKKLYR